MGRASSSTYPLRSDSSILWRVRTRRGGIDRRAGAGHLSKLPRQVFSGNPLLLVDPGERVECGLQSRIVDAVQGQCVGSVYE